MKEGGLSHILLFYFLNILDILTEFLLHKYATYI